MTQVLMRKIELKPDMGVAGVTDSSYKTLIRQIFKAPKNPGQPCSTEETRSVLPVYDALDGKKDGEHILLTESQWADLKGRLTKYPWAANEPAWVIFEDDIIDAPEVPMEEANAGTEATQ